ncbi:MAG: glutathione transferase GstA [Rubrivivax sp.]|nr:MAG: glutathione transferase GstA [Rubrivivax sp.]
MKLYYAPGACSLSPHIISREAGINLNLVKVDTATHKTASGEDFYQINAKGYVPLLELDNGQRLSEGPIIAQYLADQAPQANLIPPYGTLERYRVMEWQSYITSELHKSFSPLFNPAVDAAGKAVFAEALHKKFSWISTQLEGRSYLTGETFTVADAYLFTVAGWAKYVQLDLSGYQELQSYLARVAARPAVKEALKAEGLIAG